MLTWIAIIISARAGVEAPFDLFHTLTVAVASIVKDVLQWRGLPVAQSADVVFIPGGFGYIVAVGCTGIVPAAVISTAILGSPASGLARGMGILVAVPLVFLANVTRLVHLFYLGVFAPQSFAFAHEVAWESALVVFTVVVWLAWWKWASRVSRSSGILDRSL